MKPNAAARASTRGLPRDFRYEAASAAERAVTDAATKDARDRACAMGDAAERAADPASYWAVHNLVDDAVARRAAGFREGLEAGDSRNEGGAT